MAADPESFPKQLAVDFHPLAPGSGLGEQADEAIHLLAEHGFVAAVGVHQRHIGELAVMARQPHIVEYCPNDPGRFGDAIKVQNWLHKGRAMVGLYATKWDRQLDEAQLPDITSRQVIQVAYGWFGPETNKHIPDAGITTAYRVGESGRRLARESRLDASDKFKLGLPLGRLVVSVATNMYAIEPDTISLETWESNGANALYDILGFVQPEGVEPVEDVRPTLKPVGTVVNGHTVFLGEDKNGQPTNMVKDRRLFKVLNQAA